MASYKVSNVDDLDLIYSILRQRFPKQQIEITYDYNNKQYTVELTEKPFIDDPNVPLDMSIKVIYGDSVTGGTPLLLRDPERNLIHIETIDSIGCIWEDYPEFKMFDQSVRIDKQFTRTIYQVWTDKGWSNIKKVIRHKTNKQIYKVFTHTGFVEVTEDHSLLDDNILKITPLNCCANTKLLRCGSFPTNDEKYPIHLQYPAYEYGILFAKCEKLRVSSTILNSTICNIKAFFDGYLEVKRYNRECDTITIEGKLRASGLYYIMKVIGYNVSFTDYSDQEVVTLTYHKELLKLESNPNTIKKIVKGAAVTTAEYVYDLETDLGRFNAGVGDLVIANTDSIFVKCSFNRDDFDTNRIDTFKMATLCGDKLTDTIFDRPPIVLEFEKVFQPFILLTKKRYIGNKYEDMKDPFKLKGVDAKGIALTRRDYCQVVKNCYRDVIQTIMERQNEDGLKESITVFKKYIKQLDNFELDTKDLVVSSMLAKTYKTRPVHVILAEKLKERNEEVQVGDRIPYIYIESDDPKKAKSELGEDPEYARKHNLRYNRTCYLEQLAKPILGFMKIVLNEYPNLLDEIIAHVNTHLEKYGGKKLKPSDFKVEGFIE
jgi:hypothetical protein